MKFKIQFRVGGSGIIVEDDAESTPDFFKKVTFYTSLPETCGHCGSAAIVFDHRIAQGFQFYEIKCRECNHALRFGQYKDGAELFAKTWVEKPAPEPAAALNGETDRGFGPRRN